MISKTVQVKCTGAGLLPLASLKDFQGGLKRRTPQQIKQIETSIEKYGFSFPFFVWKSGNDNWCLDGHGRMATLAKMQADGWNVPDLPVVYVEAKDRAEAKQKLLRMNSNYGDWDSGGIAEFLSDIEIDMDELSIIDFENVFSNDSISEEKHEELKPYEKVHVLLSFPPSIAASIFLKIKELYDIPGMEVETSAN